MRNMSRDSLVTHHHCRGFDQQICISNRLNIVAASMRMEQLYLYLAARCLLTDMAWQQECLHPSSCASQLLWKFEGANCKVSQKAGENKRDIAS